MKFAIASLLVANTQAINIAATPLAGHAPLTNTCVYVNQKTELEDDCSALGNSAWKPDGPLPDPIEMGWIKGFEALYWFSTSSCPATGCPTAGTPSLSTVNEKINFSSPAEFMM